MLGVIFLSVMFLCFYGMGVNDRQKKHQEEARDNLILEQQKAIQQLRDAIMGKRH